jgi:CRP/FNR family cyclic AMP-dependent transcriptional regulator
MPSQQEARPPRPTPRPGADKRILLRDHPLFGALGSDLITRLSSYARTQKVKRGTTIFAKEDPGAALFAVSAGTVKISVPSADGRDAVFRLLNEGDVFGEIALLDGRPRTADAIAVTDCELVVIDRRDFLPLLHSYPEMALQLIEVLCAKLRRTSEQVEDATFLHLRRRLAKTLLQLAANSQPSANGRKVMITQRELGQIIGMSRESTNKQLRLWQTRNWVRLQRGCVEVRAPDALAAVAEPAPRLDLE